MSQRKETTTPPTDVPAPTTEVRSRHQHLKPSHRSSNGMDAASTTTAATWEALRTVCEDQSRQSPLARLCKHLEPGFAALADLDLELAERTARSDGTTPPAVDGVDKSAYLQWLLDKLCALSMEDGLTGLFNRRYFDHRVHQEVQRAARDQRPCSVMLLDADHFKQVNDTHGHAAGDSVLQRLGKILRDALRTTDDITTRFGGEEFAVILPGTDKHGASIAGERLRAAVEDGRFEVDGKTLSVTVSIGIATFDPSWAPCTVEELIQGADDALYKAKLGGRNQVHLHGQVALDPDDRVTHAEKEALLR